MVTSGRRPLAIARLAAAGLPVPDTLVCAEDVPAGKPDPSGYRRAADLLGARPEDCVVVEDSPAGIAARLAAGATVLGVSERAVDTAARLVVRDLDGVHWSGSGLSIPSAARLR